MQKLRHLLKNNRGGVSQFVAATISMLAIIILFLALTAGLKTFNEYGTLNDFGNQLVYVAGNTGRCSGDKLDTRYNELVSATGLKPTVTYSATYFNADNKTVQYGNIITMQLSLSTHISTVGISIPITLQVTKTAESQQYWK